MGKTKTKIGLKKFKWTNLQLDQEKKNTQITKVRTEINQHPGRLKRFSFYLILNLQVRHL